MPKFGINIKEFLKKTVIVDVEIEPSPYFGNGSGEVADGEDVSFYCHLLEDKD